MNGMTHQFVKVANLTLALSVAMGQDSKSIVEQKQNFILKKQK